MGIMKKTIVLTMLVLLMFDGRASLYVDAHTGEIEYHFERCEPGEYNRPAFFV